MPALSELAIRCEFGVCAFGRKCVQGFGPLPARILLIGEAPGAVELKLGRPFVGRSGELLDTLLMELDMKRRDIRITNTCGCVDMERDDRRPLPAELEACEPRLEEEIELCDPAAILLMGNTAIQRFFPGERVGQVYNAARSYKGRVVVPTYHPAAYLRGQTQLRPIIKEALSMVRRYADGAS